MYPHSMIGVKNKKSKQNLQKIFNFYNFGKISILHGHVFRNDYKNVHKLVTL